MQETDPFSPSEFDSWAESYDHDVATQNKFPFAGYIAALQTVVLLASPESRMSILDIGTGTGNLAERFMESGCELWCTDFSQIMLQKARLKLPQAHFVLHDLRRDWPAELDLRFDRIVSAYVFHHFELDRKIALCTELVTRHLAVTGKLIIADLSFTDASARDTFGQSVGELWEDEPYWLVDESVQALTQAGLKVGYERISSCAGGYCIEASDRDLC